MAHNSAYFVSPYSRILLGTFIGLTATLLNDEFGHARNNPPEKNPHFGCIGGKITSMLGEDSKIKERMIEQILNPSDEYHRTEAIKSYWGLIRKSERIDSMDSQVGTFLRNDPTIDPVRIGFTGLILRKITWLGAIGEQTRGINDPSIVSRLLLGFYNGFDRSLSSEIARALRHENAKDLFESCSTELWSGKASSRDEPFLERVVSAENQSPVGDLERAIQESRTEVEGVRKLSVGSDSKGVFLYQAYSPLIAEEAMTLQRFGRSFSFSRMTWFKVSFGWMLHRSAYATAANQEVILKIKVSHDGFRELMSQGVLSQADERNFSTKDEWQKGVDQSDVLIQWDPNRDFAGKVLPEKTIQIGIRGGLLQQLNQNWILEIQDVTANARQIAQGVQSPGIVPFSPLLPLPIEKAYSLDASIGRRIGLN